MQEVRLIDANALFNDLKASAKGAREWREETQDEEIKIRAEQAHGTFVECALRVKNAPTIEADIDRAEILRLCNEIEDVFGELCGKYEFPLYYYSEIMKRLKAIGKELTGNEQL